MSTISTGPKATSNNHDVCVDCGNCCQLFWINKGARGNITDPKYSDRTKKWITEGIEPVSIDEAIALDLINETPEGIKKYASSAWTGMLFRCTLFDMETKRCTDYDNRPSACSRFPNHIKSEVNPYKDCKLFDLMLEERKAALKTKTEIASND